MTEDRIAQAIHRTLDCVNRRVPYDLIVDVIELYRLKTLGEIDYAMAHRLRSRIGYSLPPDDIVRVVGAYQQECAVQGGMHNLYNAWQQALSQARTYEAAHDRHYVLAEELSALRARLAEVEKERDEAKRRAENERGDHLHTLRDTAHYVRERDDARARLAEVEKREDDLIEEHDARGHRVAALEGRLAAALAPATEDDVDAAIRTSPEPVHRDVIRSAYVTLLDARRAAAVV